jgi:hypothetical protein
MSLERMVVTMLKVVSMSIGVHCLRVAREVAAALCSHGMVFRCNFRNTPFDNQVS